MLAKQVKHFKKGYPRTAGEHSITAARHTDCKDSFSEIKDNQNRVGKHGIITWTLYCCLTLLDCTQNQCYYNEEVKR